MLKQTPYFVQPTSQKIYSVCFQTIFHVLDKKSGTEVHRFHADPFFYLHIINAYEDTRSLVVDICVYRNPDMLDCMYKEALEVWIISIGLIYNPQLEPKLKISFTLSPNSGKSDYQGQILPTFFVYNTIESALRSNDSAFVL